ncbi:MAG TPA: hypothetical protein VIZ87_06895 [Terrimicrobium sp.]
MRYQLLAAGILLVACGARPAHAQITNAIASPQTSPAESSGEEGRGERLVSRFLEGVPEETRQRFLAVREKALEDPKLQRLRKDAQRANREFFKAMRTKMLEIDPGLAELVRKVSMQFRARRAWSEARLSALSEEERQKLLSLMAQVEDDPAVAAAEKKRWDAVTTAERKTVFETYRQAVSKAMAKVDPSITPILDKLTSAQGPATTPEATAADDQQN